MAEAATGGECITVVVRCRPFSQKEKNDGCKNIVSMDMKLNQVAISNPDKSGDSQPKSFTYDNVFDENTQQKVFYEECCFNLVENVLEGFNCTIFAYGQTGCGKSWTMQGGTSPDLRGVIPNACAHIFEFVKASTDIEFLIRCSYLEIYSEEIRDLLAKDPKSAAKCEIKEDSQKGVFVKGLTDVVVENEDQIAMQLEKGFKLRTVAATNMNEQSSRSHSIFTIVVEMSTKDPVSGKDMLRVGKLNLVDLAGSERQKKTGATGDTLKEGAKINLSLSALGNVISALSEGKSKHIPYRDSKLTRLLQDSLGGNTKTLMVAAIGPADFNFDESLSTLRYANRAKNIQNKPKINEDPKDTMLREFKEEIERLKRMLAEQANTQSAAPAKTESEFDFASMVSNQNMSSDLMAELKRKEDEIMAERQAKDELMQRLNRLQGSFVGVGHGPLSPTHKVIGGLPMVSEEVIQKANAEREEAERARKERKLINKKRREEKQKEELQRVVNEKLAMENELEELRRSGDFDQIQQEFDKHIKKIKKKYEKKINTVKMELDDARDEWDSQRSGMLDTIRDQEKDIKLFEAIVLSLISEKELKKIVDKCRWNDDDMEWIVPCDTAKLANKISTSKNVDNNSYSNMATSAYNTAATSSSLLTLPASSSNSSLPQISTNRSNSMLPQLDMHGNSNSRSKLSDVSRVSSERLPNLGGNKSNERIDMSGGFVGEDSVISGLRYEDIVPNKVTYDEYKPNVDMMKVVQFGDDGIGMEKKKKKKKKKKGPPDLLTNITDEAGTGDRAGSLTEWGFAYDGAIAAETGDYNSDEEYDQDFDEDLSDHEINNKNNKNSKMPQLPQMPKSKANPNNKKSPRAKLPLL